MKEDFKNCMNDLKVETYARNEAEAMVKVLQDTLEAERNLKGRKEVEDMEIDDKSDVFNTDEGEWKQQRKQTNRMKKRAHRKDESENEPDALICSVCAKVFNSKTDITEHIKTHVVIECTQCDEKFGKKGDLTDHEQTHIQKLFDKKAV